MSSAGGRGSRHRGAGEERAAGLHFRQRRARRTRTARAFGGSHVEGAGSGSRGAHHCGRDGCGPGLDRDRIPRHEDEPCAHRRRWRVRSAVRSRAATRARPGKGGILHEEDRTDLGRCEGGSEDDPRAATAATPSRCAVAWRTTAGEVRTARQNRIAAGVPITGARVWPSGYELEQFQGWVPGDAQTTDAEGRFRLATLPTRRSWLYAWHSGYTLRHRQSASTSRSSPRRRRSRSRCRAESPSRAGSAA